MVKQVSVRNIHTRGIDKYKSNWQQSFLDCGRSFPCFFFFILPSNETIPFHTSWSTFLRRISLWLLQLLWKRSLKVLSTKSKHHSVYIQRTILVLKSFQFKYNRKIHTVTRKIRGKFLKICKREQSDILGNSK